MKPIRLEMSAFGPYRDKTVIEFEKLGRDGIFLITGATGAGKTTIFDAISYALYGESSGGEERRGVNSFRSQFAGPEDETYVSLAFEHQGKIYTIRRSPAYIREGLKDGEAKKHGATLRMTCEGDTKVLTKQKDVSEAVERLVGLTRDQFAQTVMIPQNDFMQILNAKSAERARLLQKIFRTERFDRLSARLKNESSRATDSLKELQSNINLLQGRMVLSKVEEDTKEHLSHGFASRSWKEVLDTLEGVEKKQQEEIDALDGKEDTLEKAQNEAQQLLGRSKQINLDLASLEENRAELKRRLDSKEKVEALKRVLEADGRALKVWPLIASHDQAESIRKKEREELEKAKLALPVAGQRLAAAREQEAKAKQQKEQAEAAAKNAEAYKDGPELLRKYEADRKNLEKAQKELAEAAARRKAAVGHALEVQDAFVLGQAGYLASLLQEGEPCPVCGSIHHPHPAEGKETVNKEGVEKAQKERDKAEQDYRSASVTAVSLRTSEETSLSRLTKMGLKPGLSPEKLERRYAEVIGEAEKKGRQWEQALSTVRKEEQALSRLTGQQGTLEKRLKEDDQRCRDTLEALQGGLAAQGFESETQAKEAHLSDDERARVKKAIEDYEQSVTRLESLVSTLEEKTRGQEKQDVKALEEKISALTGQRRAFQEQKASLSSALETNQWVRDQLSRYTKNYDKVSERAAMLKDLSDVAAGGVAGTDHITLEAFVQRHYFNAVIQAANRNLEQIFNGQYHLRCRSTIDDKRGKGGLNLEVYDTMTGGWRPVSSFSGGESFLASLSLALGLSDVVQSRSGGIRLDAMFIDEGFGNLDGEKLNEALDMLDSLNRADFTSSLASGALAPGGHNGLDQTEGRPHRVMVGIISHLPELENRIPKKLVITKDQSGAHVQEVL